MLSKILSTIFLLSIAIAIMAFCSLNLPLIEYEKFSSIQDLARFTTFFFLGSGVMFYLIPVISHIWKK